MACEVVNGGLAFPGGMIVCGRGRRKQCKWCGRRPVTKLCDYPVGHGRTCDAEMCDECATHIAHETDYCPKHRDSKPPAQQMTLGGM